MSEQIDDAYVEELVEKIRDLESRFVSGAGWRTYDDRLLVYALELPLTEKNMTHIVVARAKL